MKRCIRSLFTFEPLTAAKDHWMLFGDVDRALYRAKQQGRDRVCRIDEFQ